MNPSKQINEAEMQARRILVLKGGRSAEREVSLNSGAQVAKALLEAGHDVIELDSARDDFIETIVRAQPDIVFVCLHGRYGEDGTVQGLLELLGIAYVGSGVLASALAMDKVMSKHMFAHAGLPTPRYEVVSGSAPVDLEMIVAALGERTVVKPANEGSAIGVSVAHDLQELALAIETALGFDDKVLVEEFVAGVEITVGVLGNEDPVALPTIELVPSAEFLDYEAKYTPGKSQHIIPARISDEATVKAGEIAVSAHKILGCRGMSRADLIVAEGDRVLLLETNTIPGMTPVSLLPEAAAAYGLSLPELCSLLVKLALDKRGPSGAA